MYTDDTLLDKIEDYLNGKLPQAEADDFGRQIAADVELAETVAAMRMVHEGIELTFKRDLRTKLQTWEKATPMSELVGASPPRFGNWTRWIAVLLAILVASGIWFFWPTPKQNPETIQEQPKSIPPTNEPVAGQQKIPGEIPELQDNQQKPPQSPIKKTSAVQYLAVATEDFADPADFGPGKLMSPTPVEAAKTPLERGIALYRKGEFQAAVLEFDKISPTGNPGQVADAQRRKAHALRHLALENGNFAPAADLFQTRVKEQTGDQDQDEAEWYLLICLLPDYPKHQKQVDDLLKKMTDPTQNHAYREQAIKRQKRLRDVIRQ